MTFFDTGERLKDLSKTLVIKDGPIDVFTYTNEKGEPLTDVKLTKANAKMILTMTKENLSENGKFLSKAKEITLHASGDGLVMVNKMESVQTDLIYASKLSID